MSRSNKNKRENLKRNLKRFRDLKRRHKNTVAMNAEIKAKAQVQCEKWKAYASLCNALANAAKFGSKLIALLSLKE